MVRLGKKEEEPIIKPITDCIITSGDEVLKELLKTGKAKIDTEGIIEETPRNHSVILKSWPIGKKFETLLNKFSKELDNQDISWIDLSSEETSIRFEVLKQRNKDLIYKNFVEKLKVAIKGNVSFETIVVDSLDSEVKLKSIDSLLVDTYNAYTNINKIDLSFQIKKLQETITELKILEKLKPYLSKVLIPKIDIDKAINEISTKSKIDKKIIKYLFSKYKIQKLLSSNFDNSKLVSEQTIHKTNLANIETFVLDQYKKFIKRRNI